MGNFEDEFLKLQQTPPPAKLKVYAPNGDTMEIVAYLGIRKHEKDHTPAELFLIHEDGTLEVLNKRVVVKNLETGTICYTPRNAPSHFGDRVFITELESVWLHNNPSWPAILELENNPVGEEEQDVNGLNP